MTVPAILRLKEEIRAHSAINSWVHTVPEGPDFEQFVEAIQKRLPGVPDYDAVYQSLLHLAGQEITDKNLDAALWRMLGNYGRLQKGYPAYPWAAQEKDEWVPVQVMCVDRQVSRKGKQGGDFQLLAMAGSPCPMIMRKFWVRNFIALVARRLGFTAPWHDYPFRDILELTDMRFLVFVERRLSTAAMPGFEEVHVLPSQVTWNRVILRRRKRIPGRFDCPYEYPAEQLCWSCHVGLDKCPAACHPRTFLQRRCTECSREDAWFDPAHPEWLICIDCSHFKLIQRKTE